LLFLCWCADCGRWVAGPSSRKKEKEKTKTNPFDLRKPPGGSGHPPCGGGFGRDALFFHPSAIFRGGGGCRANTSTSTITSTITNTSTIPDGELW
jgi:hypothetical protein